MRKPRAPGLFLWPIASNLRISLSNRQSNLSKMKKIASVLALFWSIALLPAFAQTDSLQKAAPATGQRYKDGVAMINGKVMELKNSQQTPLVSTKTIGGAKISPDGMVTLADGTQKQLREGKAVNLQGRIVNFRDDMFLPAVILNESQQKDPHPQTVIIQKGDSVSIPKKK